MAELRFDGKVALVTGGGRGLGRAHALSLAERGARVVVNDPGVETSGDGKEAGPADDVVAEITAAGGTALAEHSSVIDGADAVVARAVDEFGRLDVVVNNAGISGGGMFVEIPAAAFDRMIDTHFGGTVAVTRAAWPHLVESGEGRVVNTSSASVFGGAGTSHYISAKAAIFGLTRALAQEGLPVGVHVNAVMPSAYTRMTAQVPDEAFRTFLETWFPPEAVAPFVVWLAHTSTGLNGEVFSVGGGRAARVFLGEAPGVTVEGRDPGAWMGREAELLSIDGFGVPATMMEEVLWQTQHLGGSVGEAFSRVGRQEWAGEREESR